MKDKHITTECDKEDKDVNSRDKIDRIILGDKLFEKALEQYVEYLGKKTEALDTDEEIQKKEKSTELCEEVSLQKLRKEFLESHESAQKLYEECEFYFQKSFNKYKEAEKIAVSSDRLYRSWGDAEYALAIINKRETFYRNAQKHFEEAIKKYTKIDNREQKDDTVLRRWGNAFYELAAIDMDNSSYDEAKTFFNQAIEKYAKITEVNLSKDDYRNWGNALFELGRMKWREFLILTENKDHSYKKFIKKETNKIFGGKDNDKVSDEKASEILSKEEIDKMMNKADALFKEVDELYKEAIIKYEEVKNEEDEKYEDVFRSWGDIYSHRGRKYRYDYLTLIEKKETLCKDAERNDRKAIVEIEENIRETVEMAIKYFTLAIKQYAKAKEIDTYEKEKEKIDILLGATHYRLFLTHYTKENKQTTETDNEWKEAEKFFKSLESSILDIFVDLSMDVAYPMINDRILFSLLDDHKNKENKDAVFFKSVVKSEDNDDEYKKVYIYSMYIISLLEIKNEHEQIVAHYTKKSIAERMLFDDEKFWLNAIYYFNDPTCGEILPGYLFPGIDIRKLDEETKEEQSEYVTFVGSFSFNYDSLNQFRLYGKEGEREGTGLSLVFNKTFFSEEFKQDRAAFLREFSEDPSMFCEESKKTRFEQLLQRPLKKPRKNTLFRCVYFDPVTNRVETVGQKERYLFYREEKNDVDVDETYQNYNDYIRAIVEDVGDELKVLKSFIIKLKQEVVVRLIIRLRYLIKHIAFKEEQECRIVKIYQLGDEDEILIGSRDKTSVGELKMHCKYDLTVSQHVKEIYFGPNATRMEVFEKCLKHKDLNDDIKCEKSRNLLA